MHPLPPEPLSKQHNAASAPHRQNNRSDSFDELPCGRQDNTVQSRASNPAACDQGMEDGGFPASSFAVEQQEMLVKSARTVQDRRRANQKVGSFEDRPKESLPDQDQEAEQSAASKLRYECDSIDEYSLAGLDESIHYDWANVPAHGMHLSSDAQPPAYLSVQAQSSPKEKFKSSKSLSNRLRSCSHSPVPQPTLLTPQYLQPKPSPTNMGVRFSHLSEKPSLSRKLSWDAEKLKSLAAFKRRPSLVKKREKEREAVRESRFLAENNYITYSVDIEDYEIKYPIGRGATATVYYALYKSKLPVALKILDLDRFQRNQIDELRKETQIMSLCRHPNLLPVYRSFVHGSQLYIVTPNLSAGSCKDLIRASFPNGLPEPMIACILFQALQGLRYLHQNCLIHRDIKAANLLLDKETGQVLLADFGVSRMDTPAADERNGRYSFVGTPSWMAPEVIERKNYDAMVDMWSFGITALELAYGGAPYAKLPPRKVLLLTLQNSPPRLDRSRCVYPYSRAFENMIELCLHKDPKQRLTAEKALHHAFFRRAPPPSYLASILNMSKQPSVQENSQLTLKRSQEVAERRPSANPQSWDFDTSGDDHQLQVQPASPPPAPPPAIHISPPSSPMPSPSLIHSPDDDRAPGTDDLSLSEPSPRRDNLRLIIPQPSRKRADSLSSAGESDEAITPTSSYPSSPSSLSSAKAKDEDARTPAFVSAWSGYTSYSA
ncbi:uncharacterized protein VTP21DRAFT_5723 [Calcarisporiella thermophila]|uniref:uncharacterized protein n=1 Tax=Calcarisporiella thermophila TaxID=911321 RepID=UPI0037438002